MPKTSPEVRAATCTFRRTTYETELFLVTQRLSGWHEALLFLLTGFFLISQMRWSPTSQLPQHSTSTSHGLGTCHSQFHVTRQTTIPYWALPDTHPLVVVCFLFNGGYTLPNIGDYVRIHGLCLRLIPYRISCLRALRYDNEEEEKKKEIAYRVACFAAERLFFMIRVGVVGVMWLFS